MMSSSPPATRWLAFVTALAISLSAAGADDVSYLRHPDDREGGETDKKTVADSLANSLMTPGLAPKREPVDVFLVTPLAAKKVPDELTSKIISSYGKRRAWGEAIKLRQVRTLLDTTTPQRSIPDLKTLRKLVEGRTELSSFIQFTHIVLGEDAEDGGAIAKSVMEAFFSRKCLHTLIIELSDGGAQTGFLLASVRKSAKGNELVGLVTVWD